MAKINDGTLKDWKNGDKLTSDLYEADREILRVAINDTDSKTDANTTTASDHTKRITDLEYNVTGTVVPMTFKELGMQNLTFDDIKLGYVDKAIEKAWKPSLDTLTRGIVEETTATDGQTVVNITNSYTVGDGQITVDIDGVPQATSSYTETSTNSITLSEPLVVGQKVRVTIGKVQPSADARFSSMGTEIDDLTTQMADSTKKADVAEVNVESFRTTGLSDADTVINAIAGSVGKKLKFPFNQTYVMTKKLRIPCGNTQIDLNGSKLDFSGFSGTTAVELVPGTSNKLLTTLNNGIILGSNVTSNNMDGIFIGLPSDMSTGATAHFALENLTIDGFRDNLVFGSQSWCNTIREVLNIHFWRYGVNFNTVTNAGENMRFFGGTFANGKAGAICVYTASNINPDVYFHSTSFDYTDYFFNVSGGHYGLFGCHLENNNDKAMITINFVGGTSPINFAMFGGTMSTGPGTDTSSPESANGRPYFVQLTGDKIAFSMDNVDSYLYNKSSELVHVGSGVPQVTIRSPHVSAKGGNPPDICGITNQLWNGDFESGVSFQGWNTSAGTGTLTLDTTTFYSGTKSANFTVASGTSGGSLTQDITGLIPGKMLLFSGYFKTNLTAGYMAIRLQFYNTKGDLINDWILDATTGCQLSGINNWTRIGLQYIIPAGYSKVTFQVYFNGVTGTGWADKMQAWVV